MVHDMIGRSDGLDAVIIAVGSELLTASRVDTNSLYITEILNDLGIRLAFKVVVGDDRAELRAHLAHALGRHPIVILSGGLGPTDDDITRDVVADYLGLALDESPVIVAAIEARFASRGWPMPAVNRRQARVPRGAVVLDNPNGTAPGLWLEPGGSMLALLPGPPRELKPMMQEQVAPRLAARAGGVTLSRRAITVAGRGESAVEEIVQPIYSAWLAQSPPIETTILASVGQVELHLSVRTVDAAAAAARLDAAVSALAAVLGDDLVSRTGRSLEEVVGDLLRARGWRIALAESCTGGLATSRLVDVPGSSAYVERAIVAYSNETKIELLGVPADLIAAHGAVSEPVAIAMADGVRQRSGVEIGVAITGVAGPDGGTEQKPVGTVCLAVTGPVTVVRTVRLPGGRAMVRSLAATSALDMVRRALASLPGPA